LNPSSQAFANIGIVSPFAEAYGADVNDLHHELNQAKRLLQFMKVKDRPTTLLTFISHIERYGDACAKLHRFVMLLRFLSALRRVNAASEH